MNTKVCSKCGESKPRSEFSKNRRKKDGLQDQCKGCDKQYRQENREHRLEYLKQWHQENRERALEYKKQYYKENRARALGYSKQYYRENRERVSEYKKQYYKENRELVLEYNKQWYQENRELVLEYNKQYRQENPEKVAVWKAKRRALKQDGIPDVISNCPEEKERLMQIYKLRDLFTKTTGIEHHVDHIWPLSKGGPHWSGNLQIITAEENLSKSDTFCEETARVIQEALDEYCCFRYGE